MEKLIYYPSFEPQDINWLKYALIYLDKLMPIIPPRGINNLTKDFLDIKNYTDLIDIQEPRQQHAEIATIKAILEIEKILMHPHLYQSILGNARNFRNLNSWNYYLYGEKYTFNFEDECIRKGLGKATSGGILLSKEIAYIYMTFLADQVAATAGGNPITDIAEFDLYTSQIRQEGQNSELKLNSIKTLINIYLPKPINTIDVKRIIEFRNDPNIAAVRKYFNTSVSNYYNSLEEDFNPEQYIKDINRANKELIKQLTYFFGGVVVTTIDGVSLFKNPDTLDFIKEAIEGSILTITGLGLIHSAYVQHRERRSARKFLTRIKSL